MSARASACICFGLSIDYSQHALPSKKSIVFALMQQKKNASNVTTVCRLESTSLNKDPGEIRFSFFIPQNNEMREQKH